VNEAREHTARTLLVLASLLFHGWALDRMLLAGPAALLLLGGALAGWRPRPSRDALVILAVVAAFLGGSELLVEATPDGAIPSGVLSPLSGVLVLLAVAFTLARRTTPAWSAALVLVVISCCVPPHRPLMLVGPVVAGVVLLCIVALAWRGRWRWDRALALAGFMVLTAAGAGAITLVNARAEGMLMPLFERWVMQHQLSMGSGMRPGVSLSPRSSSPASGRVLLALNGPVPSRLRTQVMDRFDGQHWTSSEQVDQGADPPPAPAGAGLPLEITFFTRVNGVIPAPAGLSAVDGEAPLYSRGWLAQGGAGRGELLTLTRTAAELLPREVEPTEDQLSLPPELSGALRPWAALIAGQVEGAEAKARATERYLLTHHRYSSEVDLRGDAHPLVVLLRDRQPASCGYFASAMAALLRAEGIPARLVGGFAPVDTNAWTGRTTVRARDAHAWVEVWIPEQRRWMAFDPTPRSGLAPSTSSAGGSLVRAARDGLHRLFVRLQGEPEEVLAAALDDVRAWVLLALVALLVGWRWLCGWWVGAVERGDAPLRDPRLWPHYRRFGRLLRRRGLRLRPTEGDEALLARIREHLGPDLAEASAHFLGVYHRARYGLGAPDELRGALARLRRVPRERPVGAGYR
jgi:transglutaminase-like putative cysteine protease